MQVQYAYPSDKYREAEQLTKQLGENWQKRIFEIVFTNVAMSVYPEGLTGLAARSFNRILSRLDIADDRYVVFELETVDAEFLRATLLHDKARVAPLQVRVFCLMQEAIEAAFKKVEVEADPIIEAAK